MIGMISLFLLFFLSAKDFSLNEDDAEAQTTSLITSVLKGAFLIETATNLPF